MRNGNLLKIRVREIRAKRISVNQGVVVFHFGCSKWAIFQMLFSKIDHCGGPSALDCHRKLILIIAAKQTELFFHYVYTQDSFQNVIVLLGTCQT